MDSRHYDFKKLQRFREAKFTQEQLAKLINKHPKTISRAENGRSASFSLISEIASACEFQVKEVIFDNPV